MAKASFTYGFGRARCAPEGPTGPRGTLGSRRGEGPSGPLRGQRAGGPELESPVEVRREAADDAHRPGVSRPEPKANRATRAVPSFVRRSGAAPQVFGTGDRARH